MRAPRHTHYIRSTNDFQSADFQLGINNLTAYGRGLEAIEGNHTRLNSALMTAVEHLPTYPEKALFFRLMQLFCHEQRTQEIVRNTARQYFAALRMDIYQSSFVLIPIKRLETHGWLIGLPPPFDALLYEELHKDGQAYIEHFFVVFEYFIRFLASIVRATSQPTIENVEGLIGRASLGALVRQVIMDADLIGSTTHPFAGALNSWLHKNKRHFDTVVNSRNAWAHQSGSTHDRGNKLAELRRDWLLRMSGFLSQFQVQPGMNVETQPDFAEYILRIKSSSQTLNLSPSYYLSRANPKSVWLLVQVKNDSLIYRNSAEQNSIEVPIAQVIQGHPKA